MIAAHLSQFHREYYEYSDLLSFQSGEPVATGDEDDFQELLKDIEIGLTEERELQEKLAAEEEAPPTEPEIKEEGEENGERSGEGNGEEDKSAGE